jgi:hypothetical protein
LQELVNCHPVVGKLTNNGGKRSLLTKLENGWNVNGLLDLRARFYNRKSGGKAEQRNGTELTGKETAPLSADFHKNGNNKNGAAAAYEAEAVRLLRELQGGQR